MVEIVDPVSAVDKPVPLSPAAQDVSQDGAALEAVATYKAACLALAAAQEALSDHEAARRDLLVHLEQAADAHHEARVRLETVLGSP